MYYGLPVARPFSVSRAFLAHVRRSLSSGWEMETQWLARLGEFGSDHCRGFAVGEEGVCGWAYTEPLQQNASFREMAAEIGGL
jgi:hypothetical protein